LRFAVGAGTHTGNATGAADDFLRQRITLAAVCRSNRAAEHFRRLKTQRAACLVGQAKADDQRDAATVLHLVENDVGFQAEFAYQFTRAMTRDLARVGVDVDDITHAERADVALNRQGPGVFHGVEEDRRDLAADAHAAVTLV